MSNDTQQDRETEPAGQAALGQDAGTAAMETIEDAPMSGTTPGEGQAAALRPSDLVKDDLPDVDAPARVASEEDVLEAMRDVIDPELMVNVVDLGLVYGVQIDEGNNATIDMTLTSPTCPLTDRIEYDTQTVLEGLVNSAAINWVWLPPWSLEMITDEGREQLRAIGYNV